MSAKSKLSSDLVARTIRSVLWGLVPIGIVSVSLIGLFVPIELVTRTGTSMYLFLLPSMVLMGILLVTLKVPIRQILLCFSLPACSIVFGAFLAIFNPSDGGAISIALLIWLVVSMYTMRKIISRIKMAKEH